MKPTFIDLRMADGSRHFADLPETYDVQSPEWHRIRDHVARLSGAQLAGFVTDDLTEAWIDLHYAGHVFSLNNQHGRWWLFVRDPECPDDVLARVFEHFEALLDAPAAHARAFGPFTGWRVVVIEPDGRVTRRDFDLAERDEAVRYADDAASEIEDGAPVAWMVDASLRLVHRGRHYATR